MPSYSGMIPRLYLSALLVGCMTATFIGVGFIFRAAQEPAPTPAPPEAIVPAAETIALAEHETCPDLVCAMRTREMCASERANVIDSVTVCIDESLKPSACFIGQCVWSLEEPLADGRGRCTSDTAYECSCLCNGRL